jgi:two-component system OmpR family sensor kinase
VSDTSSTPQPDRRPPLRLRPHTLRGRLTLVFALVTLGLSLAVGVAVDVQYRSALRSAVDQGLDTRFVGAEQQVEAARSAKTLQPVIPDAEGLAQVLDPRGAIIAGAPRTLRRRPVLTQAQFRAALHHRIRVEADTGPRGDRVRLLAGPAKTGDVVIVGTTLEEVTSAQHRLELALAVSLPLLAALVTALGWFIAGAALRPVQAMIVEADEISARAARQAPRRLTVPDQAGDELIELARTLNHLLERIENSYERERVFLDDASHELRTPIAIARGELELARMQAEDGTETAASLDSALEEVDRLEHLASSLLVLARTRAAGPPPEHVVKLRALALRAAHDALIVRSGEGADAVRIDVVGDVSTRGASEALERALRNLVENALRHARTRVDVRLSVDGDNAVVEVVDDGPGFSSQLLAHSFDRFTPDEPAAQGGTRLGLAIVDAIVAAHGGSVSLANRDGGAVVTMRLPLATSMAT